MKRVHALITGALVSASLASLCPIWDVWCVGIGEATGERGNVWQAARQIPKMASQRDGIHRTIVFNTRNLKALTALVIAGAAIAEGLRFVWNEVFMARSLLLPLAVAAFVFSGGCASRTQPALLECRFDETGVMMQHMQYYASAHLRAAADREAAIAEITAYLLSRPGSPQTQLPSPGTNLHPPLRSRDFWALVLAGLQNRQLIIMAYDEEVVRERRIAAPMSGTER